MAKILPVFTTVRFYAKDTFGLMSFKSAPKALTFKDGDEWVQRYNDDGIALWSVEISYARLNEFGFPENTGAVTIEFASGEPGQVFEEGELPFEGVIGRQAFIPGLLKYEPTYNHNSFKENFTIYERFVALDGVFDTPQEKNTKEPAKNAAPQPANSKA